MTRQERIDQIVRDLYEIAPFTLRDALRGNKWDQNVVLYWVTERWNG